MFIKRLKDARKFRSICSELSELEFDRQWYLASNSDVAAAGIDPWRHYVLFGRHEGRLPVRNLAIPLDFHLWRERGPLMEVRLERLLKSPESKPYEKQHARWALARWHAAFHRFETAREYLFNDGVISQPYPDGVVHLGLTILANCARDEGFSQQLEQLRSMMQRECSETAALLANAYLSLWLRHDQQAWLTLLNQLWQREKLAPISMSTTVGFPLFDKLSASVRHTRNKSLFTQPLVSVIVPVRNAAATLETAIASLFAQTWPRLELIVVDDASDDDTWELVQRLVSGAPTTVQLKTKRLVVHQGAYRARNEGAAIASGAYITVHDSDDWSHPQKIEQQVRAIQRGKGAVCSISYWTRITSDLEFCQWRAEENGWVHPNISSLMFKREVIKRLGFWDELKAGADSEYMERLKVAYGERALVHVKKGIPLSFGRSSDTSLSQSSDTHVITQFSGTRAIYMASAAHWHQRAKATGQFYMERTPEIRKFPAPEELLPANAASNPEFEDERDKILFSGEFDSAWYIRRYIELQSVRVNAFEHYWKLGRFQGFDPGPEFSQSGYARLHPDVPIENALIASCQSIARDDHAPVVIGEDGLVPHLVTVMLSGHRLEKQVFGAERCLLDMASALKEIGYNVLVTLPSALNSHYIDRLLNNGCAVAIFPYGWWQQGALPEQQTIVYFEKLIKTYQIAIVVANTLMLSDVLQAARQQGVMSVHYVHELPEYTNAICHAANTDAGGLVRHASPWRDIIITNSQYTAHETEKYLDSGALSNIEVVPNTITMNALYQLPPPLTENPLSVSIIGSDAQHKGLGDLPALCRALLSEQVDVVFNLYVPLSAELEQIRDLGESENSRCQILLHGYTEDIAFIMQHTAVVLSLSRFQESFGRTALEAMAAARAFVGYAWGALPEVVINHETGVLVPYSDLGAIAQALAKYARFPERMRQHGDAGRRRASTVFGWSQYLARVNAIFSKWTSRDAG
ncbi:glycosyltransferase [Carnimonas bestiolae]|uniref:glycosyltransferase n=1 Tax=Carnimonas bestiolae TaxID=3402172 RepID=UPI003EDC6E53